MPRNMFREAGLPQRVPDIEGGHGRYNQEIAVVRAVYPEIWCADIQPQSGGMLYKAQIADNVLPDVHIDGERPSYVEFWHRGGEIQDVWCRRVHWRRFVGPETGGEDEKRYYHKHLKIERVGDLTIRITPDNRLYLYDAESGDYCLYDMPNRTFHVLGPHVFVGSDDQDRIEYHQGDQVRVVIPECLIGQTAVAGADGISYIAQALVQIVSQLIQLTATTEIDLQAPSINMGTGTFPHAAVLGDVLQNYINAVVKPIYDAHTHTGVTTGSGQTGAPVVAFPLMPNSTLSSIVRSSA